nr:hypothetical protein [Tanacetum cinerariifolium]
VRFDITSLSSNKNNVYDILQNEIQRFYPNEAVEVKEVGRIPFCLDFQDGTVITDTRHHMDYINKNNVYDILQNEIQRFYPNEAVEVKEVGRTPFCLDFQDGTVITDTRHHMDYMCVVRLDLKTQHKFSGCSFLFLQLMHLVTYEDFERLTGPIHLPLQDIIEGLIWLHNEGLSHGNVCPCNVVVCRLEHYSMDSPYAEVERMISNAWELFCSTYLLVAGQWSRNREHRLLESALQQMKGDIYASISEPGSKGTSRAFLKHAVKYALIRAFRNGYSHILDNSKGVEQLRYDSGSFMMMIREAYPNLVLLLFKNLPPEFRNKREFSILLSRD